MFAQVRRSISSLRLVALYCCAARSQPSKDCQRCMQQPLPHLSKVSPCLRVRRDTLCLIHPRYPSSCSSTFLYIAGRNPILVIAIHGSYLVWYTRITMTHHTSRTRTRYSCVESGYVVRARRTAHGTVTMPFPTWRDPPLPEGMHSLRLRSLASGAVRAAASLCLSRFRYLPSDPSYMWHVDCGLRGAAKAQTSNMQFSNCEIVPFTIRKKKFFVRQAVAMTAVLPTMLPTTSWPTLLSSVVLCLFAGKLSSEAAGRCKVRVSFVVYRARKRIRDTARVI